MSVLEIYQGTYDLQRCFVAKYLKFEPSSFKLQRQLREDSESETFQRSGNLIRSSLL